MKESDIIEEPVIDLKKCFNCGRYIGHTEPYYRYSDKWKDPKTKNEVYYGCEACGDRLRRTPNK